MPKYITIAPTFQPYSVEELMKVPNYIKEEAEAQRKVYNEQLDQKAALDAMIGENPQALAYLQEYNTALEEMADAWSQGYYDPKVAQYNNKLRELWRDKGLKATSVIGLLNKYREERAKVPSAIGPEKDFNTILHTMDASPNYVSGEDVYKKIALSTAQESKHRIINSGWKSSAGGYGLIENTQGTGYTPNEQAEILKGVAKPEYQGIYIAINNVKSQIGYDKFSPTEQQQLDQWITKGIIDGTTMDVKTNYMQNPNLESSSGKKGSKGKDAEDNYNVFAQFNAEGNAGEELEPANTIIYKNGKLTSPNFENKIKPPYPYPSGSREKEIANKELQLIGIGVPKEEARRRAEEAVDTQQTSIEGTAIKEFRTKFSNTLSALENKNLSDETKNNVIVSLQNHDRKITQKGWWNPVGKTTALNNASNLISNYHLSNVTDASIVSNNIKEMKDGKFKDYVHKDDLKDANITFKGLYTYFDNNGIHLQPTINITKKKDGEDVTTVASYNGEIFNSLKSLEEAYNVMSSFQLPQGKHYIEIDANAQTDMPFEESFIHGVVSTGKEVLKDRDLLSNYAIVSKNKNYFVVPILATDANNQAYIYNCLYDKSGNFLHAVDLYNANSNLQEFIEKGVGNFYYTLLEYAN